MKPVDFQNILVSLIGVAVIVGFGARPSLLFWRKHEAQTKPSFQMEVSSPQLNVSEEVARLQKNVSEINTKLSDLHAFKGIIEREPLSRLGDLEKKFTQLEKSVGDLSITRTIVEEHKTAQKTEQKAKAEEEKTRA